MDSTSIVNTIKKKIPKQLIPQPKSHQINQRAKQVQKIVRKIIK